MAAARQAEPQTNLAPFIAVGSILLAGVALWYGYPGFAATYIGFIVAAFMATAPQLTGQKEKSGYIPPSGLREEKALQSYRMWRSLQWSMIVPNRGWFPLWVSRRNKPVEQLTNHKIAPLRVFGSWSFFELPATFTFWIAAGLAVTAAAFPTPEIGTIGRLINAVAVYIVFTQTASAVRANAAPEDPAPAVGFNNILTEFLTGNRSKAVGAAIGAVAAGSIAALGFGIAATHYSLWDIVHPVQLWQLSAAAFILPLTTILHAAFRTEALAEWRSLVEARAEWKERWASPEMKLVTGPRLLTHEVFEDLAVTNTFEATASGGAAAAIFKLSPLIDIQMGSGRKVVFLTVPDIDAKGQPIQGTAHPLRLKIITWLAGELPPLGNSDTNPALIALALETAVGWAADAAKLGHPQLLEAVNIAKSAVEPEEYPDDSDWGIEDDIDEDAEELDEPGGTDMDIIRETALIPGAWASQWAFPDTPGGLNSLRSISGAISHHLQTEVIVDPKAGILYLGNLTENIPVFTDPNLSKHFHEMETEARWAIRWADTLKMGARQPLVQHQVYREAKIPTGQGGNRAVVRSQPFILLQGVSIMEFIQPTPRIEPQLATTLAAAPFVSVTGTSGIGNVRPGERHQQAITVCWSDSVLPNTPNNIQPSESNTAAEWLLAGLLNKAFDVSKLARPELISATPLTDRTSKGHMWKITLRLYGGVTIAELRTQAQKIRQALNSSWLRVAEGPESSVVIVVGADPARDGFVFAKVSGRRMSNADYTTALDWEQAFLVSKVIGDGGALPKLTATGVLPHNDQVSVLDFEMPSGTTRSQFKEATGKLMAATDNQFIDVRTGVGGAKTVRILTSKVHPLPDSAGVDWEFVDGSAGALPFATSVEGMPVVFDSVNNPHILVAGASGGGKSVSLQVLLYPAALHGNEIYVVDPTKGGADFMFVEPYAKAFASTIEEAQSLMKHVYAEVRRRIVLNTANSVGSYRDLPEEIRPKHIYLVMDEFTSLMQPDPVSKVQSDDPEVEDDRQMQIRNNEAKTYIGTMTGKIAREARSAGVTLVLATQKLSAKMLDSVPGGGDLKSLTMDSRLPVAVSERFPTGWALNSELIVGDELYSRDGSLTPILGFTEVVTDRPTYAITFDDGQVVKTDAGHLWLATDERSRKQDLRDTSRSESRAMTARRLLELTPEGTWNSPAELAELLGYLATSQLVLIATKFGTPRATTNRHTGEPQPYDRNARRGTAAALFHGRSAITIALASNNASRTQIGLLELGENDWLTAREIMEDALGHTVSLSTAGNLGTVLKKAKCPTMTQERAPYLYDTRHFLESFIKEMHINRALDEKGEFLELERVVTTEQMLQTVESRRGASNWAIRLADPIQGPEVSLPLDPYVLGAWLGDGSSASGILTSSAGESCTDANGVTDQSALMAHFETAGFEPHVLDSHVNSVGTRGLKVQLRAAGVLDNKHIPSVYLRASYDQRLALLQGLMDTDGSISERGQCSIGQVRKELAENIIELARSLGIKATWYEWDAKYVPAGGTEYKVTGTFHNVQFRTSLPVFRLPRKLARLREFADNNRSKSRYIRSIEILPAEPTRCIGVAHESHLFLVGEFIPTHNTNLSRMLMGNATFGEKQSALKNAIDAPSLGDHVPRGRGLWETSAGIAEVIQVWFEPSQETFAQKLAERRDPLPLSEKVDLVALAPKPAESTAEFRDLTAERENNPPAFSDEVVVDLGEIEISFADLMAEYDAANPPETVPTPFPGGPPAGSPYPVPAPAGAAYALPAPAPAPAPAALVESVPVAAPVTSFEPTPAVEVEPAPVTAPAAVLISNDRPNAVLFLDVDGVVSPLGGSKGDSNWGRWAVEHVNGFGDIAVSAGMLQAIGQVPATVVWATDWADAANPAFANHIGRGNLPVMVPTGMDEYGWWKIGSAVEYVNAHPELHKFVWIDDSFDREGPTGLTWGELIADTLEMLNIDVLTITCDPKTGLTTAQWGQVDAWLNSSGKQMFNAAPAAVERPAAAVEPPAVEPEQNEFQASTSRRKASSGGPSDF
jgi:hypothetical protein